MRSCTPTPATFIYDTILFQLPLPPAESVFFHLVMRRHATREIVQVNCKLWALPDLPPARPLLDRLNALVEAAHGTLQRLSANGFGDGDVTRLEQLCVAARKEELAEFDADCGKVLAELDKEERLGKYTLSELDEEEQSLDRLRRWYRELRGRDLLGIPATTDSATSLKLCEERFDTYADRVYAALSNPAG